MRLYLDASALTKSYVPEAGTDRVMELCAEAEELLLSIIALPEVVSAFNRVRREGGMTDDEYDALKRRLVEEARNATVLEVTQSIVETAYACLERSPLRASDAIHVATALECKPDRFLSADHRQCDAARAAGLTVEEIAP